MRSSKNTIDENGAYYGPDCDKDKNYSGAYYGRMVPMK